MYLRWRRCHSAKVYRLGLGFVWGLSTACATGSGRSAVTDWRTADIVTGADLARGATGGESLWNALQRVRPLFLASRRSVKMVSIDGSPVVELSVLHSVLVTEVAEVRLVRASSSITRAAVVPNGQIVTGDVLMVRSWRSRRT